MSFVKKILVFSAAAVFSAGIYGCHAKTGETGKSAPTYPHTALNEPYKTGVSEYLVSEDNATGKLSLTVKNTSEKYDAVTFKAFVASNLVTDEADAQIALYLRKGQSHVFALPFTADDLPLTVYYIEEYGAENSKENGAEISAVSAGFTVEAKASGKNKKSPEVEVITPEAGEEKALEKNF